MSSCMKKALGALAIAVLLPLMLGGCKKKPNLHSCKQDQDCRVEAGGPGGVCLMGKCQECADNTDCPDLKQCVNNRCVANCQADLDCSEGHHCENNGCVEDCLTDAGCLGDKVCAKGRCVAQGMAGDAFAMGECSAPTPVYFGFDRYDINTQDYAHLDKIAQCMESNPEMTMMIGGHTDDRGTSAYNLALGDRRAEAVRKYLKSKGIASTRIETVSYGEKKPEANGNTEDVWQKNRRADFNTKSN